ncbi:Lactamase_B domain-containing protein [Durusdinium trenchii]|uniref:Lactamase_B domain-containing protein n=1 Tax=Durusdinium trenchii TaxID=1381693 RepID=A0ABP0LVT7_9DINO
MAGIQLPVTMGGPAQAQRNFGVCPMHHRRHCSGERRTHKPNDSESSTHVSHTLHVCYLIGDALFTMALHVATSQEGHREGCANPIRPEDHVTSRRDPRPFGPRLPRKGWQEQLCLGDGHWRGERRNSIHIGSRVSEEHFCSMRDSRDAALAISKLVVPSVQVALSPPTNMLTNTGTLHP